MSSPSKVATRSGASSERKRLVLIHRTGIEKPGTLAEREELAASVREGLLSHPKSLPCQFFYDEQGSALFEKICRAPEYYLTRTEDQILERDAAEMIDLGGKEAPTLVELGSGSAEKTRHLIAAAIKRYGRLHYVPIDVSASAIESSARQLVREFPSLFVTGYVADYHEALTSITEEVTGVKLVAFLGSSLGNYDAHSAAALLRRVAGVMGPEDRLLLGTDLAKDAALLEAAYNDSEGVTARFNLNLLVRINRELGGNFRLDRFAHRAIYRPDLGRVEMHLVSLDNQTVTVAGAGVVADFSEGETIHTENSHKYTRTNLTGLAATSGFVEDAAWTDFKSWFRVQRWRVGRKDT